LTFENLETYSPAQLILLNRELINQGRFSESDSVLNKLEVGADTDVKPILAVERIKVYLKKGDYQKLLRYLTDLADTPEKSLYEKIIFNTLRENLDGFADRGALLQTLHRLIERVEAWRSDPELITWMLQFSEPGTELHSTLVMVLWAAVELDVFPVAHQPEIATVRQHPAAHPVVIAAHFATQYFKRNWSYIITEAPDFLSRMTPGSQEFIRVRDTWIRSFFRKRMYSELIGILQQPRNLQAFSLTPERQADLLFQLWLKKVFLKEALQELERLEKLPSPEKLAERYYELAEFYFDRERFEESLPHYAKAAAEKAAPVSLVQLVQWRRLWIHYRLQQPQKMREIARWADSYNFDSREVAAKFCYWGVKLGLFPDRRALSCYQEFPLTYYGFRALQEHGGYPGIEKTALAASLPVPARELSRAETGFLELVHVYYLTGVSDLSDALVMHYMQQRRPDQDFFLQLADVLHRAQRFYLQQLLIELYFKEDLDRISSPLHPLLSVYYPAGYRAAVNRHIGDSSLPQPLALAVMREESSFRPEIESPAGAVGLMQLMPSTAKYVAKTIRAHYEPSLLFEPDFNVKLGVAYLNRLLRQYKGNLHYTLAAYNGGATNVQRWRQKAHSTDLDVFVETITYLETQNYVKRVLKSYYIYQLLHGKDGKSDGSGPHHAGPDRMSDDPA